MSLTKFPYGIQSFVVPKDAVTKSADYTVLANTDVGKTFYVTATATFTLPAIGTGNIFTFVNAGNDGEVQITISPNAADSITYKGSAVDNKDLINTLATAKKGDYVTITSLDGVVSWQVTAASGVWAKEA